MSLKRILHIAENLSHAAGAQGLELLAGCTRAQARGRTAPFVKGSKSEL
jgi:hypothetical protein